MALSQKRTNVSVLLASASDCDELRKLAHNAFVEHNEMLDQNKNSFVVFDWHHDKKPEYVAGDFQKKVFEDAQKKWGKSTCDILVLMLWHKFGPGTKKEYDFFIEQKKSKKIGHLLVCHYNQSVTPLEIENSKIDKLFEWTSQHKAKWAELGVKRGAIDNHGKFIQALNSQISWFIMQNKLKPKH